MTGVSPKFDTSSPYYYYGVLCCVILKSNVLIKAAETLKFFEAKLTPCSCVQCSRINSQHIVLNQNSRASNLENLIQGQSPTQLQKLLQKQKYLKCKFRSQLEMASIVAFQGF
jgi:hypothetical protein